MVKLRDYFESDLETFINANEFATEENIEGKLTLVVIDNDELVEMKLASGGEGLENSSVLFHVKKTNLDFEPHVGQDIMFNKKLYYINDVKEDEGIYTIAIGVAG